MTGTVVSAIAAVAAALATGWMAYRAKRAELSAPSSVAGGYTVLVSDMQRMIDVLKAELAQQHVQIAALQVAVQNAVQNERRCAERLAVVTDDLAAVATEVDDLRSQLRSHTEKP